MCNKEHPAVDCHRVAAVEVCSGRHLDDHFMAEDKVREIVTPQALSQMFELDFKELGYSQENKRVSQDSYLGYSAYRVMVISRFPSALL